MKASMVAMTFLAATAIGKAPKTEPKAVVDEIQGVKVEDPYRWLEDWADPKVKSWSTEQNRYARQFLAKLPARAGLEKRLKQIEGAASVDYWDLDYRAGKLFAIKMEPPKQQPMLWVFGPNDIDGGVAMTGKAILGHAVVDPNKLDPKGATTIDFYVPSPDGSKVAVSLSKNGTEAGDVHIVDTATGEDAGDVIAHVNGGTAGGSVAWSEDGTSLFYTRYPRGAERPAADVDFYQQVWLHKIGEPADKDTYAVGKDFPRIAEVKLHRSRTGKRILASVANGDGGEFAHYIFANGTWKPLSAFSDAVVRAAWGPNDDLYVVSRKTSPRGAVLKIAAGGDLASAKPVVAAGEASIEDIEVGQSMLFTSDLLGGPSQLRAFALEGASSGTVSILPFSSIEQVVTLDGDDVLFRNESYLKPAAWYRFKAKTATVGETALKTTSPATFDDAEVVQEFATSKDGTKVPMLILRRKGTKLDGTNPTLLYGYGGFNVARNPQFIGWIRPWLEQGGVYVAANLRGGSEYGEEWHAQGMLTKKQNVFDDYEACAQHLVEAKYTTSAKLAGYGRSNGGLLMGAALTQHPETFAAIVAKVGLYDMVRSELDPNGAFIATEYGTVKDKAQFEALHAYSPYHHVKDATKYPATLFMTGANDPRVNPSHSRKMTARLQSANAAKTPILLRTSSGSGHGGGHGNGTSLDDRIGEDVDMFAFLMDRLEMKYRVPVAPKS